MALTGWLKDSLAMGLGLMREANDRAERLCFVLFGVDGREAGVR